MIKYGIRITCSRCGCEDFLESIGTSFKNGVEVHEYREPDEGWTDTDKPGARHLCPTCKAKYDKMIERFFDDPDWNCGIVLETCVKHSVNDVSISPEELAKAHEQMIKSGEYLLKNS